MKTVYQTIKDKGITNWRDLMSFLEGKTAKVITRVDGNNYPDTFVISFKNNYSNNRNSTTNVTFASNTSFADISKGRVSNSIQLSNFSIQDCTLEGLKKELSELQKNFDKEVRELEEKIEILERFDLDEWDELLLRANKVFKNLGLETAEEFKKVYKSLL